MNVNVSTISGNTTADVNFASQRTRAGKTIASFTLASNDFYYDDSGAPQESTAFIRVTAYGALADSLRTLGKGSKVTVSGKLKTYVATDPVSERRYPITTLVASVIDFGHRKDVAQPSESGEPAESEAPDAVEALAAEG